MKKLTAILLTLMASLVATILTIKFRAPEFILRLCPQKHPIQIDGEFLKFSILLLGWGIITLLFIQAFKLGGRIKQPLGWNYLTPCLIINFLVGFRAGNLLLESESIITTIIFGLVWIALISGVWTLGYFFSGKGFKIGIFHHSNLVLLAITGGALVQTYPPEGLVYLLVLGAFALIAKELMPVKTFI